MADSLVAGDRVDRPLYELVRSAEAHLAEEQAKPNPDNGLIATLCDTVRLVREHCELARTLREQLAAAGKHSRLITAHLGNIVEQRDRVQEQLAATEASKQALADSLALSLEAEQHFRRELAAATARAERAEQERDENLIDFGVRERALIRQVATLREHLDDLCENANCNCHGRMPKPCPRCQVSFDQARELLAAKAARKECK